MSLTSYRAAPPRGNGGQNADDAGQLGCPGRSVFLSSKRKRWALRLRRAIGDFTDPLLSVVRRLLSALCRPGDDLLSRVLRQSTIGAKAFDGRVRDGIGSDRLARATRPAKDGSDDGGPTAEDGRDGFPSSVVGHLTSDEAKLDFRICGREGDGRRDYLSSAVSFLRRLTSPWRREQSSRTSD